MMCLKQITDVPRTLRGRETCATTVFRRSGRNGSGGLSTIIESARLGFLQPKAESEGAGRVQCDGPPPISCPPSQLFQCCRISLKLSLRLHQCVEPLFINAVE